MNSINKQKLLTVASYPSAIVHIDADAFFTSVEQAVHPELKGKPIVTGKERNIISCASYEAKALGIRRGVPLFKAKKICPELIVLPSDYETYSIFSKRMFSIMRRFTSLVEEYSVDEGFADISGLRRLHHTSYEQIAKNMQAAVHKELGITVSAGLSISKTLAKLCSDFRKPNGFTAVCGRHIHILLQHSSLTEIWGVGNNTANLLKKHGVKNPYQFAMKPEKWVSRLLGKTGREIRDELRGNMIYPVTAVNKTSYATISKCKTFTPSSSNKDFIYAGVINNAESAFIKLRRYRLKSGSITIILRRQNFEQAGLKAILNHPTSSVQVAMPFVRLLFNQLFKYSADYRATSVILGKLSEDCQEQYELFESPSKIEKLKKITKAADNINNRFGKHTIELGTSLFLNRSEYTERAEKPLRKHFLLSGETSRKRLNIPVLFLKGI
jgi:DNA polymerase IV